MSDLNSREKLPPQVSDLHTRARRRRRKIILIGSLVFLLVVALVGWWIIIASNILRFAHFEVHGNTRLTEEEVVRSLTERIVAPSFWGRVLGADHIFAWPKTIDKKVLNELGNIRTISFSRDFWKRQLTITVEEYQFFGTFCARKNETPQCVWFDKEGFFFEDAFFPEGVLVLRLDDYSKEKVEIGETLYTSEKLANALSVFNLIKELGLEISGWTIREATPDTIEVRVIDGPILYFSLNFPSSYTAQVIQSLIGQKGIRNIQYMDFRIEGRVYYKDN